MQGVETSLYSAACALCVFSAGVLQSRETTTRNARPSYFTALLGLEALSFVCEILMAHPATPLKSLWLGTRMGLSLLIAPCLWLVIRESLENERPRISALGRWHWVPVLAGVTFLLPLLGNAHFGTDYPNTSKPASWLYIKALQTGMLLCIAVFAVQVPWYLRRSRKLLLDQPGAPRWLQWPLAVVLTTWILGLLRTVQCITHAPRELDLVVAATDVGITIGALYTIVRASAPHEPVATTKYARSGLDAATIARIRGKIEEALGSSEVYADCMLNLQTLSRKIGEKHHYVSQVINGEMSATFYDLVNRARIDRAKQLLAEHRDRTVLEIALSVGFNSKSTFNTAFRKHAAMTPSEYRASTAKPE